jgi:hypothetical protein
MMNAYAPDDRAALATALDELVASGVLEACSATEFTLTQSGLALARRMREDARPANDGGIPAT